MDRRMEAAAHGSDKRVQRKREFGIDTAR